MPFVKEWDDAEQEALQLKGTELRTFKEEKEPSGEPNSMCENTKPKTSFVEPQGTTTPNHFSSKPFARHTNTNQPRRMAVFQSLSICYF